MKKNNNNNSNNGNNFGIVELIDRTLNKGVILNADLVITVAEVPLLAANLKLALASVETMLKYGVMNDWLVPQYIGQNREEKEVVEKLNPVSEIKCTVLSTRSLTDGANRDSFPDLRLRLRGKALAQKHPADL